MGDKACSELNSARYHTLGLGLQHGLGQENGTRAQDARGQRSNVWQGDAVAVCDGVQQGSGLLTDSRLATN